MAAAILPFLVNQVIADLNWSSARTLIKCGILLLQDNNCFENAKEHYDERYSETEPIPVHYLQHYFKNSSYTLIPNQLPLMDP